MVNADTMKKGKRSRNPSFLNSGQTHSTCLVERSVAGTLLTYLSTVGLAGTAAAVVVVAIAAIIATVTV